MGTAVSPPCHLLVTSLSPPRQVWILYGDGSLGYSLMEFDTFVRHKVRRRHRIGGLGDKDGRRDGQTDMGGVLSPLSPLCPCRPPSSRWWATTRAGAKSPGSRWPCWAAAWRAASSLWVSAAPCCPQCHHEAWGGGGKGDPPSCGDDQWHCDTVGWVGLCLVAPWRFGSGCAWWHCVTPYCPIPAVPMAP